MLMSRVKTAILSLLVALSVVLSYELWHGLWLTPTYVAWGGQQSLAPAQSPTLAQLTAPLQVRFMASDPATVSIAPPDTAAYRAAVHLLQTAAVYNLQAVTATALLTGPSTIDLTWGIELNRAQLLQWLPDLRSTDLSVSATQATLAITRSGAAVDLFLSSPAGRWTAVTSLSPAVVRSVVGDEGKAAPWSEIDGQGSSELSVNGVRMRSSLWTISRPQIIPLVDSFFVNPQALTRIPAAPNVTIWTDGSRAVRWDQSSSMLTFSDPNAATSFTGVPVLAQMATYLQNHGGTPADVQVTAAPALTGGPGQMVYNVTPLVNGYPLLDTDAVYTVQWQGSHAISYRRPLVSLARQLSSNPVTTLTLADVRALLAQRLKGTTLQAVTVSLGYVALPERTDRVRLQPAYQVTTGSGVVLLTLNAVTGQVLVGGGTN